MLITRGTNKNAKLGQRGREKVKWPTLWNFGTSSTSREQVKLGILNLACILSASGCIEK